MFRFLFLLSLFFGTLYVLAKPTEVVSLVSVKTTKLRAEPAIRNLLFRYSPRFSQTLGVGAKSVVPWKGKDRELTILIWETTKKSEWSVSEPGTDRLWKETIEVTEIYADPETKRQFLSTQVTWTLSLEPGKEIINQVTAFLFAKKQMEAEAAEALLLLPDL